MLSSFLAAFVHAILSDEFSSFPPPSPPSFFLLSCFTTDNCLQMMDFQGHCTTLVLDCCVCGLCVCVFHFWCGVSGASFFFGVFSEFFPIGVFSSVLFPLVDVGQHPSKSVVCLCAPSSLLDVCWTHVVCVVFLYIVRCNDFVWHAQQATLPNNSYCMVVCYS